MAQSMTVFNAQNLSSFEIFNHEFFGQIRTLTDENNQIWFYGNDVAAALQYEAPRNAVLIHTSSDDKIALKYSDFKACTETVQAIWDNKNDFSNKIFINESGIYCLIFGSHLDKAKEFKSWVTHSVIPSIREHGGYIMGQEKIEDKKLQSDLLAQIESLSAEVEILNTTIQKLQADNASLSESAEALISVNKALSDKTDALTILNSKLNNANALLASRKADIAQKWHKAVQRNNEEHQKYSALNERFRNLQKRHKFANQDADDLQDILFKEANKNTELRRELSLLRYEPEYIEAAQKRRQRLQITSAKEHEAYMQSQIRVDRDGFIIS